MQLNNSAGFKHPWGVEMSLLDFKINIIVCHKGLKEIEMALLFVNAKLVDSVNIPEMLCLSELILPSALASICNGRS